MDLTEAWYEHSFLDNCFKLRIGKIDITGGFECRGCPVAFDGNNYAHDETSQFLNGSLVNNVSIAFPDPGLAVVLYYNNPEQTWYVSGGIADAEADSRETGFNTLFDGDDFVFYAFETGITPTLISENGQMPGAYRIGFWGSTQDKQSFSTGRKKHHETGLYTCCNQMVMKENNDPEDDQGLGVFGRYGLGDDDVNNLNHFWSLGLSYKGAIYGRNDDIMGFGFAQGVFSDSAGANEGQGFADDHENVCELFYNFQLSEKLSITPDIQYIKTPVVTARRMLSSLH